MRRAVFFGVILTITGMMMGTAQAKESRAIFAGGCFWCMQPVFDATTGVSKTTVGYTGGTLANPTYEQVSEGDTGHSEAIEVVYDDSKVSYETLVTLFFENIDPFDSKGQFADKGEHYKTVVFANGPEQRETATKVMAAVQAKFPDKPLATTLRDASVFYPAEEYHQGYYQKNTMRYNLYKHGSGRVTRLKEIWGDK